MPSPGLLAGEAAGKSRVDRGKQGTKRSLLVDARGVPIGCVSAPANRHDPVFLRPTLEKLGRFEYRFARRPARSDHSASGRWL